MRAGLQDTDRYNLWGSDVFNDSSLALPLIYDPTHNLSSLSQETFQGNSIDVGRGEKLLGYLVTFHTKIFKIIVPKMCLPCLARKGTVGRKGLTPLI